MMELSFFFRGAILGFSIAAPVGQIGILCIRRTLTDGRAAGLASGLGAATADALYGCIAGFGLTGMAAFLVGQQGWLRLVGGLFLLYLGVRTFLARPAENTGGPPARGLLQAYVSTFLLTVSNPVTILVFAAVFSGLGIVGTAGDPASAAGLVSGVFCGSALWWLILSTAVGVVRRRFTPTALVWVNRISGCTLAAFGVAALMSLFILR